jgi:hypothetical protein
VIKPCTKVKGVKGRAKGGKKERSLLKRWMEEIVRKKEDERKLPS